MGYLSTLALHIKGDREEVTKVQEDYFNGLNNSPVTLWHDADFAYQVETFHEKKETYIDSGKYLWKELSFIVQEEEVSGEIFWKNTKWIRYFEHQCSILLDVCTKYSYSWYYMHIGEEHEDIVIKSNSRDIENFNKCVFKPYIIDHCWTRPVLDRLENSKKIREKEIAKRMLVKNTDKKFISEVTGLSLREVEGLP